MSSLLNFKGTMFLQLAILSIFTVEVIPYECGRRVIRSRDSPEEDEVGVRIAGGMRARDGAWPWLVALASSLYIDNPDGPKPHFNCGGSLISHRHVLTAAHCSNENIYLARLGASYLHYVTLTVIDVPVAKVIVHEEFDRRRAYNDIAIAVLRDNVEFTEHIQPICLPYHKFLVNSSYKESTLIVAGWGDVTFGEEIGSNALQEVILPVVDLKECKKIYKEFNTNITSKNICVGTTGGKDACQGDSGGPLMARAPNGKSFHVVGIVSHGHGCGLKGIPGVFTRVSSYLPWINKILTTSKEENPKKQIEIHKKRKKHGRKNRRKRISARFKCRGSRFGRCFRRGMTIFALIREKMTN